MPNETFHPSEAELVQGLRAGDNRCERLFVNQYSRRLMGLVTPQVRTPEDAEDLVSEVLTKAILKIDQFNPAKARFSTWIISIAKNAIADYWRSRREEEVPLADDEPAATQLLHAVTGPSTPRDTRRVQAVRKALDSLSERERTVLECRLVGIPHPAIAAELTQKEGRPITAGTVRQLHRRALHKLRQLLLADPEFAHLQEAAIGPATTRAGETV